MASCLSDGMAPESSVTGRRTNSFNLFFELVWVGVLLPFAQGFTKEQVKKQLCRSIKENGENRQI